MAASGRSHYVVSNIAALSLRMQMKLVRMRDDRLPDCSRPNDSLEDCCMALLSSFDIQRGSNCRFANIQLSQNY